MILIYLKLAQKVDHYTMLDKDAGRGRWFGTLPANQPVQGGVMLKGIKGDFTFFDAVQTIAIPLIPAE